MAVSYNEDVRIGSSTFHVQTEYYKKSGKIVSNIFKDGTSIKRLEREVEEGLDIDSAVGEFHRYVVDKLRKGVKSRTPEASGGFVIPEDLEKKVIEVINPYFGVASYLVIDEARSASNSKEEFVESLLEGLPEDVKPALFERLTALFSDGASTSSDVPQEGDSSTPEEFDQSKKEKLLKVLSDYFGIMALPVLEEALEEWDGRDYHDLVSLIVDHVDDESEREELYNRLMFL